MSALLFRQRGLRWASMPWLPLSHPQANLRLYVHDEEGDPAVLFRAMWVPSWLRPPMRWIARMPAQAARLDFPAVPVLPDGEGTWSVRRGSELTVRTKLSCRAAPGFGTWPKMVAFFRCRETGYMSTATGLRKVQAVQPPADPVPVTVEVLASELADQALDGRLGEARVHSSFLCERLPFEFELLAARRAEEAPLVG